MSSVRLCHNTRNFGKLCKTPLPVPGTFGSSVRSHTLTRTSGYSCKITAVPHYPGYGYAFCCNTRVSRYLFRFNPKTVLEKNCQSRQVLRQSWGILVDMTTGGAIPEPQLKSAQNQGKQWILLRNIIFHRARLARFWSGYKSDRAGEGEEGGG